MNSQYDSELQKAIDASLQQHNNDSDLEKAIAASLHDTTKPTHYTATEEDPELAMALRLSAEEEQNVCKAPNCDHDPNSRRIPKFPPELQNADENKIPKLNDVLLLINSYHCKKQTKFRNINLKKLVKIHDLVNELNTEIIGMEQIKNEIASLIFYFCRSDMPKNQKDFLHMIISGSPGTGKTMVAHIIGKILYKLDCIIYRKPLTDTIASAFKGTPTATPVDIPKAEYKFVEVKRQDLVGQYVGQTATKTQKKIDEALGGVFFFDECYSLSNVSDFMDDPYGTEAGDCINENMSNHAGQIVFMFAGYPDQIDKRFLTLNAGFPSRIQFRFDLPTYTHTELCSIFVTKIKKDKWKLNVNTTELSQFFATNYSLFKNFGRDVERLILHTKKDKSNRTAFAKVGTDVTALTMENIINGLKSMQETAVDKNKRKN